MPTRNTKFYSLILLLGDAGVLMIAFTIAYVMRVQLDNRPLLSEVYAVDFAWAALTIVPFWLLIFAMFGLYSANIYTRRLTEWSRIVIGCFVGVLFIIGWEYVTRELIFPARLVAVYTLVGATTLIIFERELLRAFRTIMYRFNRGISRVMIIGDSAALTDIARSLDNTPRSGYDVVAVASPRSLFPSDIEAEHFSRIGTALEQVDRLKVTTIIQTNLYDDDSRNQQILAAAQTRHIQYNFIPGEPEFYTGKNTIDVFLGYPMITVHQTPLIGWGSIVKRVFDFIASFLGIIVLSPLLLVIVLLQKTLNPGPIFFSAKRLTRGSRPFGMLKFRSMRPEFGPKDAVQDFIDIGRPDLAAEYEKQRKITSEPDPRITKFGHFIRKTSIDELPQLFNVLKGDLSLIGPRPIEPIELPRYRGRGALLLSVQSGITGLWQVSGRNNLTFDQRVELELYYAQNWSFWLDMKILMKTPGALLKRRGVPDADSK